MAYCMCSRCDSRDSFLCRLSYLSVLPPSLWKTARKRMKYCQRCSKISKQPMTNFLSVTHSFHFKQSQSLILRFYQKNTTVFLSLSNVQSALLTLLKRVKRMKFCVKRNLINPKISLLNAVKTCSISVSTKYTQ